MALLFFLLSPQCPHVCNPNAISLHPDPGLSACLVGDTNEVSLLLSSLASVLAALSFRKQHSRNTGLLPASFLPQGLHLCHSIYPPSPQLFTERLPEHTGARNPCLRGADALPPLPGSLPPLPGSLPTTHTDTDTGSFRLPVTSQSNAWSSETSHLPHVLSLLTTPRNCPHRAGSFLIVPAVGLVISRSL